MALTPTQWTDSMRASIAQMVGAMREIAQMETQNEWKPYFDAWMKDVSLSKDTRKTVKHLLPAVISMSEDISDTMLAELGINAKGLPATSPFGSNHDIEPSDLKIAQIDMLEKPSETAHAVLILTKPTRTVMLSIHDMTGTTVMPEAQVSEVMAGVFVYHINWASLPITDGYYIVHVQDGYLMDAKEVEVKTPPTKTHTQADEAWMLQNIGGSGVNTPTASADGHFI